MRKPTYDPPIDYTPIDWKVPIWDLPRKESTRLTPERLEMIDWGPEGFINDEEMEALVKTVLYFDQAFSFTREEKGMVKRKYFDDYVIKTIPHEPWMHKTYPIARAQWKAVNKIYDEHLRDGDIEYCDGPYVNPHFFVQKKDGNLRKVVDLSALNAVTIRDANTPPNIVDFTEALAGRVCYGAADIHSFFDQVRLAKESRPMTAIKIPGGTVQSTTLPQGFTNSPAVGQRVSYTSFGEEIPEHGDVFVDDAIFKGPESDYDGELWPGTNMRRWFVEYLRVLSRWLRRYIEVGLTISGAKFIAIAPRLAITGVIIDKHGRHPDPKKIVKLDNWPCPPPNASSLRGFLGLANYLRPFIKGFAEIDAPLRKLLTGRFRWNDQATNAMRQLQKAAGQKSILSNIDYEGGEPLILAVDSSTLAVGWTLYQQDPTVTAGRRLVQFGSMGFNEVESRYGQSKLELCGVYRAIRKLRYYLFGLRTIVEVDAASIREMINTPDLPNHPMNRWIAYIKNFDVEIKHVPAKQHHIPDGLSRTDFGLPLEEDEWPETKVDLGIRRPLEEELEWIERGKRIQARRRQEGDPNTGIVSDAEDSDESVDDVFETNVNTQDISEDESSEENAEAERANMAEQDQSNTEQYSGKWRQLGEYLQGGMQFDIIADLSPARRAWIKKHCNEYFLGKGGLYKRRKDDNPVLVIGTEAEKRRLMTETHEHETLHRGRDAGIALLAKRVWWERMNVDYSEHVRSCDVCQRRLHASEREEYREAPVPPLFSKFSMDIVDLGSGVGPYRYLVLARDNFSGWPEGRALMDKTAASVRQFLEEDIISRYGSTIETILTDNGPENAGEVAWLVGHLGYKHAHSTPYNPEGNAVVERGHASIVEGMLKASADDRLRTHKYLPAALWADRITRKRSHGYSPYELVYGMEPQLPIDVTLKTFVAFDWDQVYTTEDLIATRIRQLRRRWDDLERARFRLEETRRTSRAYMDEREGHKLRDGFSPDTMVLVRNPAHSTRCQDRWLGPYRVISQALGGGYYLRELDGTRIARKVAPKHLRQYYPRADFQADNVTPGPDTLGPPLPASIPRQTAVMDGTDRPEPFDEHERLPHDVAQPISLTRRSLNEHPSLPTSIPPTSNPWITRYAAAFRQQETDRTSLEGAPGTVPQRDIESQPPLPISPFPRAQGGPSSMPPLDQG